MVVAGSGRVSESACGCRLSFETGGGVGVDARGDSGGDGVADVEGVEGGRWTIVVRVIGNRGRNRLMVSVVVLCLFAAAAYARVMARRRSLAAMHVGLAHLNGGVCGCGDFGLRRGRRG